MAKFTVTTVANEAAILGDSRPGPGIHGTSVDGRGGFFHSDNQEGVFAESNASLAAAVAGIQTNPTGTGAGVYGEQRGAGAAVVGRNIATGRGAFFSSQTVEGLVVETQSSGNAAVVASQLNPNSTGAALFASHAGDQNDPAHSTAGFFKGNVIVTGDISFPGADCAEEFTVKPEACADPGTVMVLDDGGELVPCRSAYCKGVAGVIAGAGSHRPGIIMDRQPLDSRRRQPIALVGKVFCKVDASYAAIGVGDLLTSSTTEGHAMKVVDPSAALGSVIGKAMAPLADGRGLIPILVALQ
jgi:hypothetical protein